MGITSGNLIHALDGLNRAWAQLEKTADRLARVADPPGPSGDQVELTDEMVNLIQARNSYVANLKSLETVNEMEKHVIDVLG
ncbi:MAG: hypothetical protein KIT09_27030 [Bryobacteraceae bacterium]|nr:hypothetical protein [Bryobacteraceae bacterium]